MIVKSMRIWQIEYGDDKGQYTGVITFIDETKQEFKLNITPENTDQYLALVADQIIESANEIVESISCISTANQEGE